MKRLSEEKRVKVVELPLWRRETHSGTEVRRRLRAGEDWRSLVPPVVAELVEAFGGPARIQQIGETRGGQPAGRKP